MNKLVLNERLSNKAPVLISERTEGRDLSVHPGGLRTGAYDPIRSKRVEAEKRGEGFETKNASESRNRLYRDDRERSPDNLSL